MLMSSQHGSSGCDLGDALIRDAALVGWPGASLILSFSHSLNHAHGILFANVQLSFSHSLDHAHGILFSNVQLW